MEPKPRDQAYTPRQIARFWERVSRGDGCWEWMGSLVRGYGHVSINDGTVKAHRMAFELSKGPIPPGMRVLHACDNPRCVNPEHLSIGTPKMNTEDMVRKGRHRNGSVLNEALVREIRRMYADGVTCSVIAKTLGVGLSATHHVAARRVWKDIV